MENVKDRNYGIDLLRLVSMFLICLRHTLSQGSVLVASSGVYNAIYNFIFILTCPAVDCFAIISGYFATNKKIKFVKIIRMWFQVLFYSFGISLAINLLRIVFSSPEGFELSYVISSLFPLLNHRYWYFSAYVVLFFFMPFINKAFCDLNKEESKKTLIALSILIVIMYAFRNASSHDFLSEGRSAFWLILMYIFGILLKKIDLFNNCKKLLLFFIFIINCIISFILNYYCHINISANIFPLYWISAIILVSLFTKINPNKKIVGFLSPLSFGVFLFHTHYYFKYYFLSERFLTYSSVNSIKGIIIVLLTSLFIYIIGLLVDYIRTLLFKIINIDSVSIRISKYINGIVNKAIFLLNNRYDDNI